MNISLGDINAKLGKKYLQTDDYGDNGVRILNFVTLNNLVLKRERGFITETFINTPGPLLMGRLETWLMTY
jgi:hypothetical protein